MNECMYVCMYVCIYVCMYVYVYVYVYVCVCMCMYVYVYVCVYVCVYTHIHTCIHTHMYIYSDETKVVHDAVQGTSAVVKDPLKSRQVCRPASCPACCVCRVPCLPLRRPSCLQRCIVSECVYVHIYVIYHITLCTHILHACSAA